ncbi:MAG: NAD(+)/NADH kinase [Acidobacteriota bacterium]
MVRKRRSRGQRFRRVGLVAKVASTEAVSLVRSLHRALTRRKIETLFDDETAGALGIAGGFPRAQIARQSDLVLIAGGDGTLLSVARDAPASTPILGINVGLVGFLAGLSKDEALRRLDEVLAGGFRDDPRRRLEVTVPEGPHSGKYRALNDAVLNKEAIGRISAFSVSIAGRTVAEFRGDGVIVATPTGSTAYNLSAGGPILDPSLFAVVVTPICPHTLSQRPLVVPDSTPVGLTVIERGRNDGVNLTLDGQESFRVPVGVVIEVRQSRSAVTLLRPPESDHFQKLVEKLNWGV